MGGALVNDDQSNRDFGGPIIGMALAIIALLILVLA
jgi:hypothetical protein